MDILVSYDVNTQDKEGRRRLRRVAKICEGWGQRVQLSVFECRVSDVELERMKQRLLKVIDRELDSLRIYRLRGKREEVVEAFGRDSYVDFTEPLVL
jgi:CRISPR-associated protein Cas2